MKLPTLEEFEANMKNCPLHKARSSQFKNGMIAGYIETLDMINGIFYEHKTINTQLHSCTCTNYNGEQCYNCLNGFHKGCSGKGKNKCKKEDAKQMGVKLIFKS